jgi:glycosyltransferase involved in cell wall biosynthesis
MIAKEFSLAIHYHSPFFKDKEGNIYIVSFVGLWLDTLCERFKAVHYIGFMSDTRLQNQDSKIVNTNKILFHTLGPVGPLIKLPLKIIRTKVAIAKIKSGIDGIIVRAPTSRQKTVLNSFKIRNMSLYIVGERPIESILKNLRNGGLKGLFLEIMGFIKQKQIEMIATKCLVISNSKAIINKYKLKMNKDVFYVPSSSIQENDFYYIEDRFNDNNINLLFVGRICKEKGVSELLSAVAKMKSLKKHILLQLVGSCHDVKYEKELKEFLFKFDLTDVVNWRGYVPYGDDLLNIYRQADALILPTKYEGFPHVIYEAQSNGVLVITTKVGGIAEACKHKEEVYFIEKNPESIVSAINELSSNESLRRQMLKRGYGFAKRHLMKENVRKMADILEFYWK